MKVHESAEGKLLNSNQVIQVIQTIEPQHMGLNILLFPNLQMPNAQFIIFIIIIDFMSV